MIEDPQPPSYTPVNLNEHSTDPTGRSTPAPAHVEDETALVTTSFRRINRLLLSTAGWTSNFRGIGCAIVLSFALSVCGAIFQGIPFVPRTVGVLLASLATVQLSTVWTHVVVSAPSSLRFYQRLPPFGKTFQATWAPVSAYWAATQVTTFLPFLVSRGLGLLQFDLRNPTQVPDYRADAIWKSLLVLIITVACMLLLVVPAQVILIRVQASLLPPDEDTIVPFDRSFGGQVEPAVITGKGYVNFRTAWMTFSRESWIRLYKLLAKILLATLAVYALFLTVVVPEFWLMVQASRPTESN